MRNTLITLIFSLIHCYVTSQELDEKTLDSIYIKALNSNSLEVKLKNEIILIDNRLARIKENFENQYNFIKEEDLFKYARKNKNKVTFLKLYHVQISKDTLDINYYYQSLIAKRGIFFKNGLTFKRSLMTLPCDNEEYLPFLRYIHRNQKWILINED